VLNNPLLKELDTELDLCLSAFARYTLLPELKRFLGKEKFLEFLELFSGSFIKVPSDKDLARWLRDYNIYKRLSGTRGSIAVEEFAKQYHISTERVRHIYMEVRDLLKRKQR